MCGIVGIVSQKPVAERLSQGLKRLEYRGYDSAGISTLHQGVLQRHRVCGNLEHLELLLASHPLAGTVGIGHTRWATHGAATEQNAHPHMTRKVAVVHNGIIENYAELKKTLAAQAQEVTFESTTDTEVLAHLMTYFLDQGDSLEKAVRRLVDQMEGTFALAFLFADYPEQMVVIRRGSPLVIGYGEAEIFVGSDAFSLSAWTREICYLEEGDYAFIGPKEVRIFDQNHQAVERPISQSTLADYDLSKGDYSHFTLKEIFEQPKAIQETLDSFVVLEEGGEKKILAPLLTQISPDILQKERLRLIACGTSYYASLVAQYWFEQIVGIPVTVEIASEYRYRESPVLKDELAIFVSQSGETIDTIACLSLCKERGQSTLAIVNTPESSMARLADHTLYTLAGPEIGVASTKAFTAQLTLFMGLVLAFAQGRKKLSQEEVSKVLEDLFHAPAHLKNLLKEDFLLSEQAQKLKETSDVLFIGRGVNYPMALEGALKLKELSYIHAAGIAAGELKHGTIALVDPNMFVVVLIPSDGWFTKTASNLQEVLARGGQVICLTDPEGREKLEENGYPQGLSFILLPSLKESSTVLSSWSNLLLTPLLYSVPIQLLAYYTALIRGTNVDQPRNLAKSVTVE